MLCCAEPAGSHVDSRMCGVGINFQSDATGALTVQSLVPRSPAAIDGQIKAGDLLEQVDKERVFRSPMKRVAGLLLGPQGSAVTLTFQRPHNNSFTRLQTGLHYVHWHL